MRHALPRLCVSLLSVLLALPLAATRPALKEAARQQVLATLQRDIRANYILPEVGEKTLAAIQAREAQGAYAALPTLEAFAEALQKDLIAASKDVHFSVTVEPDFKPEPENHIATAEEIEASRKHYLGYGYGIFNVDRLPGRVGYLDLRGFGPSEFMRRGYEAAFTLLEGTHALILDLREHTGGDPESMTYFVSHFFAEGDTRQLVSLHYRAKNETRQYWTTATTTRYTRPVYVLISPKTLSGGEACAYELQAQRRAKLVGEVTNGGANPCDPFPMGYDLVAYIPTGQAIHPITHTSWEQVGVKPDVQAPAADALKVAHAAILRDLIAQATDPERRKELQESLDRVNRGEGRPKDYSRKF
ncbi:S41 family peptidase [Geothrix sp. PMB-07]|uniref:S41 family peptidase n=1 Tax=Geothrix sp. PMB-07 TaxID=3068640 RepID=UPI0027418539|nr:S41 family peptidase [Geothrix sp. PMB-07]WLT30797.1 S41 family peptidase [Geothrix sp. PMB-07]